MMDQSLDLSHHIWTKQLRYYLIFFIICIGIELTWICCWLFSSFCKNSPCFVMEQLPSARGFLYSNPCQIPTEAGAEFRLVPFLHSSIIYHQTNLL